MSRSFDVRARMVLAVVGFGLLAAAAVVLATGVGPGGVDFSEALRALAGLGADVGTGSTSVPPDLGAAIIRRIRLPRALLGLLAGGALSLGGMVFQALLRNPLAEPYILGVSGGAAVGAIIGQLLGLAAMQADGLFAFAGGLAATAFVLALSPMRRGLKNETLLLAGVMVNAFCSAIILFLMTLGSDRDLHSIIFWLMGSLSDARLADVFPVALAVIPCALVVVGLSHGLNLMSLGERTAKSLGLRTGAVILCLFGVVSLMVSMVVGQCGLIGFVGLVVPHFLRLVLGADHRVLAPACFLGGGAYLVVCDLLSRILPGQGEIPVGVVTALVGAPVFIVFLLRRGR